MSFATGMRLGWRMIVLGRDYSLFMTLHSQNMMELFSICETRKGVKNFLGLIFCVSKNAIDFQACVERFKTFMKPMTCLL